MRPFNRRRYSRAAGCALCLLFWAGTPSDALAQDATAATAPAELRERLGHAYLRLELTLREAAAAGRTAGEQTRARLNRDFDQATMLFLSGNGERALAAIDSMSLRLIVSGGAAVRELDERARQVLDGLNGERRTQDVGGQALPYLLHVPSGTAPATGWPVLVAVHGAGGDERMFFGGYGAGSIRELADRHGLAVLTPRAPLSPSALIGLVDTVAAAHGLDARRLALLGHSMGAGIVAQTAAAHGERVSAVVCIAGSCGTPANAAQAPMLVVAGGLDPLFRADVLERAAAALRAAGAPVEFRLFQAEGHTLVVGEALPDALAWLARQLQHERR
jgi:predicted esterase